MKIARKFIAAAAGGLSLVFSLLLSLTTAGTAHAALVWSYTYAGAGVSGSGYLTTASTLMAGAYSITGISGTLGTQPVESLLTAGSYVASGGGVLFSDNLLHPGLPGPPSLGLGGFTVRAGTDLYNVYATGGQHYQLAGADCGALTCGSSGHLGSAVSFTAALVPSLDWAFSYSGAGIAASGVLTTLAAPVGGRYTIVGLSGLRNGQAMNALFPAGSYFASGGGLLLSDNLLAATDPFLDSGGFTFHAGTDRYNVYTLNGQSYDLAGADCGGTTCGTAGHLGTPVSFTAAAVPEPTTLSLLSLALVGLGLVRRRRR